MSNGFLIVAGVDKGVGLELAAGFELTLMHEDPFAAVAERLAGAANIGIILSLAAAEDETYVGLLRALAERIAGAQLIVAEPEARAAFSFLPQAWPELALDEALRRARLATERRGGAPAPTNAEPPEPTPQEAAAEPAPAEPPAREEIAVEDALPPFDEVSGGETETAPQQGDQDQPPPQQEQAEEQDETASIERGITMEKEAEPPSPPADRPAPAPPAGVVLSAPPTDDGLAGGAPAPQAPAPAQAQPAPEPARKRDESFGAPVDMHSSTAGTVARGRARLGESARADATAFAPKKLRRGEAELVRIAIHQPKDLQAVIKAARKADPRTTSAPQSMGIGEVALGASVGVALEVKGAACEGGVQRRTWEGEPLEFSFAAAADADVKQVVILARVFVDDAQIGVLAFTRGVTGPRPKALPDGERVRLKRHKRVFLSYSSKDRETVSAIATAYQMAGIEHFWDRASLKSGEEWSPRLRREIDRCDLFHLCWSKSAAASEWVEKEATHALNRKHRAKKPDITVQMLDGPPWAPHPAALDSINFDDFVRAAIVGYARGDSEA